MSNRTNATPAQLRAARGLLGWSQADLARVSGVSPRTVKTLEVASALAPLAGRPRTVQALISTRRAAGVTLTSGRGRIGAERSLREEAGTAPERTEAVSGKAVPGRP
ncbi:helix-turn-helix domain-containing protein, partial [Roseomonas sp. GCM10028921]